MTPSVWGRCGLKDEVAAWNGVPLWQKGMKLTTVNTYAGNKRKLRVTASPNMTLTMRHVPQHCRRARTVLLGPLTPQDLDAASFINFKQGRRLLQLG